jgi:Ca2+-binding EF-hand superfamily protein
VLLTRLKLFVLGALGLVILGSVAVSQQDMSKKRSGYKSDPAETFKQYSGGKDEIVVSEVTVPERMSRFVSTEQLRERMSAYLQKKGITNGRMTLEQFKDYSEESRREMMEKMQKGDFSAFKRPGDNKSPGSGSQTPTPQTPAPTDTDGKARELFKNLDKNGDGYVAVDELQSAGRWGERLLRDREKFDLNKDDKIDVNEYIEYFKSRTSESSKGDRDKGKGDRDRDRKGGWNREEDDKPKTIPEEKRIVYRIGSLPKDLPKWFEELDKDKDGQVGLYEWKRADRAPAEFLAMDANADGFVTVEELLRFQKAVALKKDTGTTPVSTGQSSGYGKGTDKGKWGSDKGKWGSDKGKWGKGKGKWGNIPGR